MARRYYYRKRRRPPYYRPRDRGIYLAKLFVYGVFAAMVARFLIFFYEYVYTENILPYLEMDSWDAWMVDSYNYVANIAVNFIYSYANIVGFILILLAVALIFGFQIESRSL